MRVDMKITIRGISIASSSSSNLVSNSSRVPTTNQDSFITALNFSQAHISDIQMGMEAKQAREASARPAHIITNDSQ